jgi:hypothetical protein
VFTAHSEHKHIPYLCSKPKATPHPLNHNHRHALPSFKSTYRCKVSLELELEVLNLRFDLSLLTEAIRARQLTTGSMRVVSG